MKRLRSGAQSARISPNARQAKQNGAKMNGAASNGHAPAEKKGPSEIQPVVQFSTGIYFTKEDEGSHGFFEEHAVHVVP